LALCAGHCLERQSLLEQDAEDSCVAGDDLETEPMEELLGSSMSSRIAASPQQGRRLLTLQTLSAWAERVNTGSGKSPGFSLNAGVAAKANERRPLERLCG
jgi:hypothetical protein